MDQAVLHALSEALGGAVTRRVALRRLLITSAAGSLIPAAAVQPAATKKKRRRRKRCIKNTPAFTAPKRTCRSSKQCCGSGTCCDTGAFVGCFNLLNNTGFCGTSCAAAENCINTGKVCVNGKCVEP